MCKQVLVDMKNYGGDLADIIRTGGTINGSIQDITDEYDHHEFDHNKHHDHIDQYPLIGLEDDSLLDEFGDPFSLLLQDPLSNNTTEKGFDNNRHVAAESSRFFSSNDGRTAGISCCTSDSNNGFNGGDDDQQNFILDPKINDRDGDQEELFRRPSTSFFSRMLQISQAAKLSATPVRDSPAIDTPAILAVNDMILSNSKGVNAGLQISSPRNAGIKRRKSQAKKVVCIPAPAPLNSRPSGEVVPSDLWAWRKYGQKPIKGSPYPRSYYRCSSSKGCPARKQVERSRSDPNMLVITYTSDHNHPWPTQRNALAGSTRNTTNPAVSKSGSKVPSSSSSSSQTQKQPLTVPVLFKQEQMDQDSNQEHFVKEEIIIEDHVLESTNYNKPPAPILFHEFSNNQSEDFFSELGELESDPMELLFTNGYSQVLDHDHDQDQDDRGNKSLDPFTFYDWAAGAGNINNSSTTILLPDDDDKGSHSRLGFKK